MRIKLFITFDYYICQVLNMNKGLLTTVGYVLFAFGFLSILFSLVGLQLSVLKWMSAFGRTTALIIQLIMLFGGLIIMYISKFPPQED